MCAGVTLNEQPELSEKQQLYRFPEFLKASPGGLYSLSIFFITRYIHADQSNNGLDPHSRPSETGSSGVSTSFLEFSISETPEAFNIEMLTQTWFG